MLSNPHPHPKHALRHALTRHVSSQQAMIQAARDLLPPMVETDTDIPPAVIPDATANTDPAHPATG